MSRQDRSPGFRWTAAELSEELTGYLRRGGERKLLFCHPGVARALAGLTPPGDPLSSPASFFGDPSASLRILIGIDIITSGDDAPGEWRLVRAKDNSIVTFGTLP